MSKVQVRIKTLMGSVDNHSTGAKLCLLFGQAGTEKSLIVQIRGRVSVNEGEAGYSREYEVPDHLDTFLGASVSCRGPGAAVAVLAVDFLGARYEVNSSMRTPV